jgi:hypothetical protein
MTIRIESDLTSAATANTQVVIDVGDEPVVCNDHVDLQLIVSLAPGS